MGTSSQREQGVGTGQVTGSAERNRGTAQSLFQLVTELLNPEREGGWDLEALEHLIAQLEEEQRTTIARMSQDSARFLDTEYQNQPGAHRYRVSKITPVLASVLERIVSERVRSEADAVSSQEQELTIASVLDRTGVVYTGVPNSEETATQELYFEPSTLSDKPPESIPSETYVNPVTAYGIVIVEKVMREQEEKALPGLTDQEVVAILHDPIGYVENMYATLVTRLQEVASSLKTGEADTDTTIQNAGEDLSSRVRDVLRTTPVVRIESHVFDTLLERSVVVQQSTGSAVPRAIRGAFIAGTNPDEMQPIAPSPENLEYGHRLLPLGGKDKSSKSPAPSSDRISGSPSSTPAKKPDAVVGVRYSEQSRQKIENQARGIATALLEVLEPVAGAVEYDLRPPVSNRPGRIALKLSQAHEQYPAVKAAMAAVVDQQQTVLESISEVIEIKTENTGLSQKQGLRLPGLFLQEFMQAVVEHLQQANPGVHAEVIATLETHAQGINTDVVYVCNMSKFGAPEELFIFNYRPPETL